MENKQKDKIDKNKSRWDDAITEAERLIAEAGIHLAELKQALCVFKKRKADGVPFPGESIPTSPQ